MTLAVDPHAPDSISPDQPSAAGATPDSGQEPEPKQSAPAPGPKPWSISSLLNESQNSGVPVSHRSIKFG
jgi:hypothetical protein